MGLTLCIVQVKDDDDDEEEEEEEGEGEGEEAGGKMTEAYNGSVSGSGPGPGQSTNPTNSPSRGAAVSSGAKSYMKHSDSSFGLHSPDSFNDDVQVRTGFCIVWTHQANCL